MLFRLTVKSGPIGWVRPNRTSDLTREGQLVAKPPTLPASDGGLTRLTSVGRLAVYKHDHTAQDLSEAQAMWLILDIPFE